MKPSNGRANRYVKRSIGVLRRLFGADYARKFSITFWDGSFVPASEGASFVFCINAPYALRAVLTPPLDLSPGRAFVDGAFDVDGDLEAAIDAMKIAEANVSALDKARLLLAIAGLPRPPKSSERNTAKLEGPMHSRKRDAAAIGFHYNQPIAFYRSFLDPSLVYSCAYFDDGVLTLEEAQRAKLDYVLQKLHLAPDESFLAHARARLCVAAARYGLPAIDTNSFELWDTEVIRAQSQAAKRHGFTGKAAIHPKQVDVIVETFSVDLGELDEHRRTIKDYESDANGFAVSRDRVLAPPFVARARRMLEIFDPGRGPVPLPVPPVNDFCGGQS